MSKKIINTSFILITFVFLTAGLVKTIFFPMEKNEFENRRAYSFPALTVKSYTDGSFQDNAKKALSDQVFLSEPMKKLYNTTKSEFVKISLNATKAAIANKEITNNEIENNNTPSLPDESTAPVIKQNPKYIKAGDVNIYGENYDYILYNPTVFEWVHEKLDVNISGFNQMIENCDSVEFYLYYIEKETDINFENDEKSGVYEYLTSNIDINRKNIGRFKIDDFESFSDSFYRTDHHWNDNGSYLGYVEVAELLSVDKDTLIEKGERVKLSDTFKGSKTQSAEVSTFSEPFFAVRYDIPELDITENGISVEFYGKQNEYFDGTATEPVTYGNFYGGDMGEIIFDSKDPTKENILILGESYDNAILNLLSCHFGKTYSIDMRFYSAYMGKQFNISEYIKEHNITKVLLIGNIDFFINEEFIPEF